VDSVKWPKVIVQVSYYGFTEEYTSCLSIDVALCLDTPGKGIKIFEEPYRSELKAIINKVGYDYDIDIVELEIPVDHIHMVVRSESKVSRQDGFSNCVPK